MAEITDLTFRAERAEPVEFSENFKVVQIAKLGIIISNPNLDLRARLGCVKVLVRQGIITQEEGAQLWAARDELEKFAKGGTQREKL